MIEITYFAIYFFTLFEQLISLISLFLKLIKFRKLDISKGFYIAMATITINPHFDVWALLWYAARY